MLVGPENVEKVLFAGLPVTAVWVNLLYSSNNGIPHIDNNTIGSSFVFISERIDANEGMVVTRPNNQLARISPKKNEFFCGNFHLRSHFYHTDQNKNKGNKLSTNNVSRRIMWILYFDRRFLMCNKYSYNFG